jgi:hypothetical protein
MAVHSRFPKTVPAFVPAAGFALLAACGEHTIVDPLPPVPIPDQVFEVTISNARNNCNITRDLGSFSFLALIKQVGGDSYNLFGVLDSPVPAKFMGDRLTFSVTVTFDSGFVTLGADWLFSKDRQSFSSGATTFDVRTNNGHACLFTFASTGVPSVVSVLDTVPSSSQPGAAAASNTASLNSADAAVLASSLVGDGFGSIPDAYKSGNPGGIFNGQPVGCSNGVMTVRGGTEGGGLTVGPTNVAGTTPVAVTVFFQGWDAVSLTPYTAGWWDFGGDVGNSNNAVHSDEHNWLSVAQRTDGYVLDLSYNLFGSGFSSTPTIVGGRDAVYADVRGVSFIPSQTGWYKVWVQYSWYNPGGTTRIGTAWLVFNDARSYIGVPADQIAPSGWCYITV